MSTSVEHISVCICTFKRPDLLAYLLSALEHQKTKKLFTYSVVIVDNDYSESARSTVEDHQNTSTMKIAYHVEKNQNIALARNRAVKNAKGEYIAFIDDDEFPTEDWLLNLFQTYKVCKAHGILGPVKPHFNEEPPKWIIKGKILDRKSFNTGTILKRSGDTRTGNVLLRKDLFKDEDQYKGTRS